MSNINYGRVILGGLVAGVILNVGEFLLNGVVLASQMKEHFFDRMNLPEPGPAAFVVIIGLTFVLGIVIVLGYAAIRSRFGPGPKTAIIAALFAWFGVYFYSQVIGAALGFIPTSMLLIALAWGLVEYILAALAGAVLYKET